MYAKIKVTIIESQQKQPHVRIKISEEIYEKCFIRNKIKWNCPHMQYLYTRQKKIVSLKSSSKEVITPSHSM